MRPCSRSRSARTAAGAPSISTSSRSSASLRRRQNCCSQSGVMVKPVRASISCVSSFTALPVKMRIDCSTVSCQPSSPSISASTRLVIGSESTSTPSQSNSTASNGKSGIGRA